MCDLTMWPSRAYIWAMKPLMIAVCLGLMAMPIMAEEKEDGLSLMEQGALLFFKGLEQEVAPALDGFKELADTMGPSLQAFALEMGPALTDLMNEVEDWSSYHPPEILPNGDIILRKKQAEDDLAAPETDEIDL